MTDTAPTTNLRVFDDPEAVARGAAERFVEVAGEGVAARGRFGVALAGGSTPRRVYELLAGGEFRDRVDWARAHLFFGDERTVPPDHADSNYRAARDSLISRVPVPAENVHRMVGEGDAAANARLYEDELRGFFRGADFPQFDFVMLGMGEDGHTASLFPGSAALDADPGRLVVMNEDPSGTNPHPRMTLTYAGIARARLVVFTVEGEEKRDAFARVRDGDPSCPAAHVRAERVIWLVDRAAAGD